MSEDGKAVALAWLFPEDVSGWFCYSLAELLRHDAQGPNHVNRPEGGLITISTGPRVAEARNQIVDVFGERHPSADWLLMIDSDMTFSPDLVEQLLAHADPERVPILGALCFAGGRDNEPWPTIWREISVEEGWYNIEKVYDYPTNALCEVSATGGACLLIHRQVLAAMRRPFPKGFGTLADGVTPNAYPWFSEGLVGPKGQPLGEDVAFCRKARLLGIPVHVHTGITTGHMKSFEITEDRYRAIKGLEPVERGEPYAQSQLNRAQRRARNRKRAKGA